MSFFLAAVPLVVLIARIWTGDPWRLQATKRSALAAPSTRVVDGGGGMLTPGFIDAHIHRYLFDATRPLQPFNMRFLRDKTWVADRISAYVARLPEGEWLLGLDRPGVGRRPNWRRGIACGSSTPRPMPGLRTRRRCGRPASRAPSVYNRTRARAEQLRTDGAQVAETPAEAAVRR